MQCSVTYIDDYRVLALIGDGGQANVYLCVKDSKLYAVKVFNTGLSKSGSFSRETKLLSLLEHQNLIKMIYFNSQAIVKCNDKIENKRSIIVLEYAQKGELYEYISIGKAFKPQVCKAIFIQLLNGMEYLSQKGVAHRDIKPQNILFDRDFKLKISDFGLSTFNEGADKDFKLKTKVGTEGFKAPEIQQGEYNGEKADIFALGVILFVLFVGSPPFLTTKSSDKIYRYIVNKNFEKFWSIHEKNKAKGFFPQQLKQLLNSFFSKNPNDRPTLQKLKQSSWLNSAKASASEVREQLQLRFKKIIEESEIKRNAFEIVEKKIKMLAKQVQQKNMNPQDETSVEQNISFELEMQYMQLNEIKVEVD